MTPARLLVVDDEPALVRSVERILSGEYDVKSSTSPVEALEIARKFRPHLAIVDIRMEGLDGFEVMNALKRIDKDVRVILMTGSVFDVDQKLIRAIREKLVDLIDQHGNQLPLCEISEILDLEPRQEAEALAARANMTSIVRMLHDKSSQLMDMLIYALSEGKLCVIDVSQMRSGQALVLSGLILRRIFDRNQDEFTKANGRIIPTISLVEVAQAVLN